jgi:hypothetical protein
MLIGIGLVEKVSFLILLFLGYVWLLNFTL